MPPPGQGTDPAEHRGARPGKQAAEDEARHAEEDPQAARKHRGAELEQTDGDGGCQNIEGGREAQTAANPHEPVTTQSEARTTQAAR